MELTQEKAEALAETFRGALEEEFGGRKFPNPEGWSLVKVSVHYLMKLHVPVAEFSLHEKTLGFILTPTDPATRVYKRSRRFDLVYFSYDEPDEEQHKIYQRDRTMIDRMVAWLQDWDERHD